MGKITEEQLDEIIDRVENGPPKKARKDPELTGPRLPVYKPWIRESREKYSRLWEKDPRLAERYSWECRIKQAYKLLPEDVARIYHKQDRKCAICRINLLLDRRTHIDHNHKTGKVRGLLCHECNMRVGFFETSDLMAIMGYLKSRT